MNKKIYFGALVALSLFACNQAEEPQPSIVSSSENVEGTFELNLSATVSSDAMRALSFQGLDDLSETPKISANSDFTTHAFFRKAGSPEVGYATIHWEARQEGGRVKLIRPTTNIVLANMSDQTIDEGEEWYVSGIAGGGVLNAEKTAVSFEPDLSSAAEALRAPIAFKWTRIYKNKMINVHFQPKGVLLRAVVANHVGKDVAEIDFDLTSNELDYNGKFDFSAAANSIQAIEQGGHEPVWKFSTGDFGTAQASTLKFRAKDFAKDSKQRIMVWGMSRELSSGQKLTVKPSTAKTVEVLRAGRPYLFESKVPMENTQGYTIEMELDVVSPALLLAKNSVNQAGDGFATDEHTEAGMLSWTEFKAMYDAQPAAFNGYHWPGGDEYQTIVPEARDGNKILAFTGGEELVYQIPSSWTKIGVLKYNYSAEYKSTGTDVAYGLTLQKREPNIEGAGIKESRDYPSAPNNRRRTATRYTRDLARKILTVEMVRIGEDSSIQSVNDIASEGWWTAQAKKPEFAGRIYKVEIALNGYPLVAPPHNLDYVGKYFSWQTSVLVPWSNQSRNYTVGMYIREGQVVMSNGSASVVTGKGNIRLVKDMDI